MGWVQIIIGALTLAKELIGFIRERSLDKKDCPKQIKNLKSAIKQARESGDTNELEKAFADIGRSTDR